MDIVEIWFPRMGLNPTNPQPIDGESHMDDNSDGYWDYRAQPPAWRRRDTGQFAEPPQSEIAHHVQSPTQLIPITQESTSMSSFNPDDANAVSRFFQGIADKVIQATTFAKELDDLKAQFEDLKRQVEAYRENNARLDEEVSRLRTERAQLQDENAAVRHELETEKQSHVATQNNLSHTIQESDHWHTLHIQTATDLDAVKVERDTAQIRVMELEEALRRAEGERDAQRELAKSYGERLTRVKEAMERTLVPQAA